jgi:hypothetical protein
VHERTRLPQGKHDFVIADRSRSYSAENGTAARLAGACYARSPLAKCLQVAVTGVPESIGLGGRNARIDDSMMRISFESPFERRSSASRPRRT